MKRRYKEAAPSKLYVEDAGGSYTRASDAQLIAAATSAVARVLTRGGDWSSPKSARRLLPALLGACEWEVFCLAHLDNRHKLIHFEELSRGTISGASVHAREVVRSVIRWNSAAVICVHNHPSGNATASQADELITTRIKEALALIDVKLLDHLIVGGTEVNSLSERGLL